MKKYLASRVKTKNQKSAVLKKPISAPSSASQQKNVLPRFSPSTFEFIQKASRQKKPEWLDKNRTSYEQDLLLPLQNLARQLKETLQGLAPGYHFPQKGIGRIKRSSNRALETGTAFKDWISYTATRPSGSRFDHNPSVFFMIYPDDEDGDEVLLAGGLYMPSSRQLRSIREAIANDASAFDKLFATKSFSSTFKGGFSDERKSSRPPRGFDPQHPRMEWLKLQAYFVWRSYSMKEFSSPQFANLVAEHGKQILVLNELLEKAIGGRLPAAKSKTSGKTRSVDLSSKLADLADVTAVAHKHDF